MKYKTEEKNMWIFSLKSSKILINLWWNFITVLITMVFLPIHCQFKKAYSYEKMKKRKKEDKCYLRILDF